MSIERELAALHRITTKWHGATKTGQAGGLVPTGKQ
jgi:hypothetical protein